MPDFQQNFIGHKELPIDSKSSVINMSAIMDMYLNGSDSLPFHDNYDIDIKSEIEAIATLNGIHGITNNDNDFSNFNFNDIPSLELGEINDVKWNESNLNYEDSNNSTMINPSIVMPIFSLAQNLRSPSPTLKESHLTFSPSSYKILENKIHKENDNVKKDLTTKLTTEDINDSNNKKSLITTTVTPIKINTITNNISKNTIFSKSIVQTITKPSSAIKTINKTPVLTFRNALQTNNNNQKQFMTTILNQSKNIQTATVRPNNAAGSIRKFNSSNNNNNNNNCNNNKNFNDIGERIYPKPAYSYSCLIAMALKNSRTGSLPVSEIYNFMCKHFPYFKTAPNGWKNSVRHNLSLNKCFEKIEKPTINGSQRKGCLWAMNPTKISKMDEEVQKWSRKDPLAIRKAMINPENLESLERGELKFACTNNVDGVGDIDDIEMNEHVINNSNNINNKNSCSTSNMNGNSNRRCINNCGDSCGGSIESDEGSDYEQENHHVNIIKKNFNFIKNNIQIKNVNVNVVDDDDDEDDDDEEEEEEDEEIDVYNNAREIKMEFEYTDLNNFIKQDEEDDEDDDDEEEEVVYNVDDNNDNSDVDVGNEFEYKNDDEKMLRMEVALARKELFDSEKPMDNKKRRTFIIHN